MPGLGPQRSGLRPPMPGLRLQRPSLRPRAPGLRPWRPGLRPQRPSLRHQKPSLRPQRAGFRPQRPGLRTQRPSQGGDGRTYGWTDGRTDGQIFPYCTGLASPSVPSGAAAQKNEVGEKLCRFRCYFIFSDILSDKREELMKNNYKNILFR